MVISVTCNTPKKSKKNAQGLVGNSGSSRYCSCCPRRHFLGSVLGTGLLPVFPSFASDEDSSPQDPLAALNRIRPSRPDWYEELFASAMDKLTESYEAEIAVYKSQLFANLKGKAGKILEIGIGTGPNLKYYADYPGIDVFGVDPNRKMEKYAQAASENAGLTPSNFRFMQGILECNLESLELALFSHILGFSCLKVAEALPVNDASVDAVVGTLVLCSVNDVDQALQEVRRVLKPGGFYIFVEHVAGKDGTLLRYVQGILDPLQQTVVDGCHLTRSTAANIAKAGFAGLDLNQAVLSSTAFINPQIYGIAYR
ncbi:hypothetical protein DH2020_026920 [Rehmannia glutinosa]|uniref:Methyltransferase type 11 domain-containing protein n=1 Tax=Rehmannia glutinosa TaxID=99300 RepID=A0ABR0VZB2_REHGL